MKKARLHQEAGFLHVLVPLPSAGDAPRAT
jgi:hypothetical protein